MKVCYKCKLTLDMDLFCKNKSSKDGLSSYCKPCHSEINKAWQKANKDKCREKSKIAYQKRGWSHNLILGSNSSAKRRGLEHNISAEYLESLLSIQDGRCYWTNIPLTTDNTKEARFPSKVSVDRLDPNKGYIIGNVVLCTTFVNLGRSDTTSHDFKMFLISSGMVSEPHWEKHDTKLEREYAKALLE